MGRSIQSKQGNKSDVIAGFEWLGDEIEYASPRPGEDPAQFGPASSWFSTSGLYDSMETLFP